MLIDRITLYLQLMKRLQLLWRYLKYLGRAQTIYYIHSPFVYNFAINIIKNTRWYYAFEDIEQLRQKLLSNKTLIDTQDFGAGSVMSKNNRRSIKKVAQNVAVRPKIGRLLFDIVHHFKPNTILELGTSLGISSLYLAAANQSAKVFTIEGCPETARLAQQNFDALKVQNIELSVGQFDKILPEVLKKVTQLDLAFIDGNHRKIPTLDYFEQCLSYANNKSIFIFDDIHWSKEMEEAWEQIKTHPKVTVSIDLFFIGIVFFREGQAKEHFTLFH